MSDEDPTNVECAEGAIDVSLDLYRKGKAQESVAAAGRAIAWALLELASQIGRIPDSWDEN